MSVFDNLKLLELLRQEDVTTYLAADTVTSHTYLLHWLPPDGSAALLRVAAMLDDLPEEARKLIVEAGRRDGRAYLVTQNPPTFLGLEGWLKAVHDFLGFDRLEKKGAWRIPQELLAPGSATPAPEAADAALTDAPTTIFVRPSAPSPQRPPGKTEIVLPPFPAPPAAAPAPKPPQAPAPAREAEPEPGEFTRMFLASPSRPPAAPAETGSAPSEASGMFQLGPERPATEQTRNLQLPPAEPEHVPGEFTRMLHRLDAPAPPVAATAPVTPDTQKAPPEPAKDPGEFTRLFGPFSPATAAASPGPNPAPNAAPAAAPAPPPFFPTPHPPPPPAEPGEFTRIVQGYSAPERTPLQPRDDPFHPGNNQQKATPLYPSGDGLRSGGATGMYARPEPAHSAAPVLPEGPSDYTRLIAVPPAAAASAGGPPPDKPSGPTAAAQKPAPAKAPSAQPGLWIFVAVLALLAVCAIAAILYFATRR